MAGSSRRNTAARGISSPTRGDATVWRRFGRNRLAKLSAALLALLIAVSLLALPFSLDWYNVQSLEDAVRHPPAAAAIAPLESYSNAGNEHGGAEPVGILRQVAHRTTSWFGHDDLGRSLLYRVLLGLLVSLGIGLAAAAMAVGVGTLWGAVAAFFGGRVDLVMMRLVDVLFGLPYILMVILFKIALTRPLTSLFGGYTRAADLVVLVLAIGSVSWLTMARVIRGQVLSLRGQPFVEAARAAGAGPFRILRCHILPNLISPIVVYATLVIPQAILQESFLSFLGIGVQQPTPSLGRLAADGVEAVNTFVAYWWLIGFPCGVLVLTLLALNFIGDGLRDAFDPKAQAPTLV